MAETRQEFEDGTIAFMGPNIQKNYLTFFRVDENFIPEPRFSAFMATLEGRPFYQILHVADQTIRVSYDKNGQMKKFETSKNENRTPERPVTVTPSDENKSGLIVTNNNGEVVASTAFNDNTYTIVNHMNGGDSKEYKLDYTNNTIKRTSLETPAV